jgi:D-serine deaminase-like pyridoxal phosphate-dependent protein
MRLDDLPTPALVLDRRALARNVARMQARAKELGVRLRPHMKTAKSIDVARMILGEDGDGITVSTLKEARYFLDYGIRDITYAVGLVPSKLEEAAQLIRDGADLKLITDDVEAGRAAAARGKELGVTFKVMIEIDSGGGRAGLFVDDPAVIELGRVLAAGPGTTLHGVLTHAGHSYSCPSTNDIVAVAEQERATMVDAANRLRQAGLPCPVVSVGSTPTALFARSLEGVTEMRPGVFVFMDLFQAQLGVCAPEDIAVSVLASVVGHKADGSRAMIDAGALALSQDQSLEGFGRILGKPWKVAKVSQEHGHVYPAEPGVKVDPVVGERVRVLPNHVCMMAAMHPHYHVVDGGDEVVAVWERCNGW